MLARIRTRLTFANTTATLALLLALGGGSYATAKLSSGERARSSNVTDNSVRSGDIIDENVRHADLGKNSVHADNLADDSVTGGNIADGTIQQSDLAPGVSLPTDPRPGSGGTQGAQGPQGPPGPQGATGPQGPPASAFSTATDDPHGLSNVSDGEILDLELPAGSYVLTGNVHGDADSGIACHLELDGNRLPGRDSGEGEGEFDAVQGAGTLAAGGTAELLCRSVGASGTVDTASLIAMRVDLTEQAADPPVE